MVFIWEGTYNQYECVLGVYFVYFMAAVTAAAARKHAQ